MATAAGAATGSESLLGCAEKEGSGWERIFRLAKTDNICTYIHTHTCKHTHTYQMHKLAHRLINRLTSLFFTLLSQPAKNENHPKKEQGLFTIVSFVAVEDAVISANYSAGEVHHSGDARSSVNEK